MPDFRRPRFLLMNGIGLIPLRGGALAVRLLFHLPGFLGGFLRFQAAGEADQLLRQLRQVAAGVDDEAGGKGHRRVQGPDNETDVRQILAHDGI